MTAHLVVWLPAKSSDKFKKISPSKTIQYSKFKIGNSLFIKPISTIQHHKNPSSVPPLIETPRLGLRNWTAADLPAMAAINANPKVMEYFPATQTVEETKGFIERAQASYEERGYTYFAVDHLKDKKMIGFIGLLYQEYPSRFTPATDIGWRLDPAYWGRGLATEGAGAALTFGLQVLKLPKIISVAVRQNKPSIKVMQKIGLEKLGNFQHPLLTDYPSLKSCVAYGITR